MALGTVAQGATIAQPSATTSPVLSSRRESGDRMPPTRQAELKTVRAKRAAVAWAAVRLVAGMSVVNETGTIDSEPSTISAAEDAEQDLDSVLEDIFEQDSSRIFYMSRIPHVLTPDGIIQYAL